MLVDVKISRFTQNDDNTITVVVRISRGDITTEDDYDPDTHSMQPVTRYRRAARVLERTYTVRQATFRQVLEFLKVKLAERAAQLGATVVDEQSVIDTAEAAVVSEV